jgi:hypothetical protein
MKQVPSEWLLGTWRSARAYLPMHWTFLMRSRPARVARREPTPLSMVFTPKRVWIGIGEDSLVSSYQLLWQNADSAFVTFGPKKSEFGMHLHFLSPEMFWVHGGHHAEHFEKQDRQ